MKLGTKTYLFGVHQFLIHPTFVTIAWVLLYKSFPSLKELFCIFIHDIGYLGKSDLKGKEGDKHPELGAKIASYLLGEEWGNFILGHSTFYATREGIGTSKLMAPDKYWHCFTPFWIYFLLSWPTGELKYYKELKHARQVSEANASYREWYKKLQEVCRQKAEGNYIIKRNELA